MNVRTFCSGIGAPETAWADFGWRFLSASEIDPQAAAVLAARHPGVPNVGDMTTCTERMDDERTDLVVAGTPCQSFSVAGLRRGLADPRGNLALVYLGLVDRLRPRWVVWENVPGVLSSGRGRDFGAFLGALGKLGYGFAWRVLDAQYVRVDTHARAVPQRRRRVFVVAHLGDWRRAAAVLVERASLCGHPAPSREAGKVAPTLSSRRTTGGGLGTDFELDGRLQPVAGTLQHNYADKWGLDNQHVDAGCPMFVAHTLRATGHDASEDGTGRGTPMVVMQHGSDVGSPDVPMLRRGNGSVTGGVPAVAFQTRIARNGRWQPKDIVDALTSCQGGTHADSKPHVAYGRGVRRITPRECERLQGFPDDYTAVEWRGKPMADWPRYRMLGNSMAVNVMRWIGQRIQQVEAQP